jgi:hypothetical protein
LLQALLERFEFFPVKCRVQRVLEISRIEQDNANAATTQNIFKTKVNDHLNQNKKFCVRGKFYGYLATGIKANQ